MADNENDIINEEEETTPSESEEETPSEDDPVVPQETEIDGFMYILLNEEPDDWTTGYKDYYMLDDGKYVNVEGDEAPTFETDKYYQRAPINQGSGMSYDDPIPTMPFIKFQLSDGLIYTDSKELTLFIAEDSYFKRLNDGLFVGEQTEYQSKYILLEEEPSDWSDNYKNYYMADGGGGYTHIEGDTAPTFETGKYYRLDGEEEKKKSVTEIAQEVWKGKWGNGDDRKKRLTEAGWDYKAVQAEVNRLGRVANGTEIDNKSDDKKSTTPSSDEKYHCYIQAIDPATDKTKGGLYLATLPQETQFYKINGDTSDKVVEGDSMPPGQGGRQFTIVEEKTITDADDSNVKYIFAKGYWGWWIYKETVGKPNSINADSVTPAALQGFDNWTIIPWDTPDTCVTNFEVVQMIYSFDTHRVIARDSNSVSTHTDFVKNKADVLTELNWLYHSTVDINPDTGEPMNYRLDDHYISKGDMVIFVTNKSHRPTAFDLNDSSIATYLIQHQESCEKLRRNPDSDATVNALYYVEDVVYGDDDLEIVDIKMRCLWTDGKIGKVGKSLQNY